MNWVDIALIAILIGSIFVCQKRGFVQSLFKLCSTIIAIILGWIGYPILAKTLRNWEPVYGYFKSSAKDYLRLDEVIQNATLESQVALINNLPLPNFIKESMLNSNNPVIYNLLNVNKIEDYIAGYLANICINILSFLIVCIVVSIIMSSMSKTLNIVTKLPVISTLNKLGGIAIGVVQGVISVWIIALVMLFLAPLLGDIGIVIQQSKVVSFFLDYNLLLNMIKDIRI